MSKILVIMVVAAMCLTTMACAQRPTSLADTRKTRDVRNQEVRTQQARTRTESRQMTLPVSVVRLAFTQDTQLSAQSDYAEVERLFKEVNAVWSRWGITWEVSAIETKTVSAADFITPANGFASPREFRDAAAELISAPSGDRRWRVYFMRQFPIAGSAVYIVEKSTVLYGELNKEGNRYPVILAHELGHSLGLRHVSMAGNLMYAGPGKIPSTDLTLTPMQIRQARQQAAAGPFFMNPGDRGRKGRRPVIN